MKKTFLSLAVNAALCSSVFAASAAPESTASIERDTPVQTNVVQEEPVEKITVTGSRIKRDSFSVATPLVTMSKDAISDTGLGSLSEILVDNIPSISASISNTNSQSSVASTGLSSISLRDLGSDRTLTLIDGRRVVSNSYSGNVVSLSTIPSGMVERVEVISGGASATYGADAVAGVVNIITQTSKEGASFKARTGESIDGGGKEFTIDADFGQSFDDGRGYAFFSANWDRQFGMSFYDRERAQVEASYRYDEALMCNQMLTFDGYQCMRDITQADWASKSDGTPGGVFLESSRNEKQFWYDGQTLRDDWKGNEERFGVNSDQYVMLKVPSDSFSIAGKADYYLSDDVKVYGQVQLSIDESFNNKSPEDEYEGASQTIYNPDTGERVGLIAPGYIPIDNPYVPQAIIDSQPYKNRIYWDRRFNEVGNIATDNTRTTLRSWAGIQGTIFDGEWDWDVSAGFGKFHQEQLRYNELDVRKLSQALNAEKRDDGTIVCKDEAARAAGCVPINLFGAGSITPEMADWIRVNPEINTYITQMNLVGYMTGELFDLPAGSVSAVFGGEYRKDKQDLQTSLGMREGGITFNVVPQFEGEIDVYEAFAEFDVPLLKNAPLAKHLSLETSLRLANYSIDAVGTVPSYKVGVLWKPIDELSIRTNFARAQRAPTITELMSPARGDYDGVSDICDGLTATSSNAGHDQCRQDPVFAALLAENPDYEYEQQSGSVYSPNAGNANLKEESADTFTLGFTASPSHIENLQIAVDYYDIAIDGAISVISNERILQECYNSSQAFGSTNPFCNEITRDSEGQITEIVQREDNLDEVSSRGFDVALEYIYHLDTYGRLDFKADYNHVLESSTTYLGLDGLKTDDYAGYGSAKDKLSATITWRLDEWRVRYGIKYLGKFTDSLSREREYADIIARNEARCALNEADSGCIANPETLEFHKFGSYLRHDLSVNYDTSFANGTSLRVFGGINNLFDNVGPFTPGGRGNYYSGYGTGMGRFAYLGAEVKF
ncbi:TonB-dependent receptor [Pseudoalteromonas luteoviolacea B = ATCC 29581]|nr:TonB-dependent receptor [Pseudoalteromonas luteoviolacea B = ATCC 29581]